MGLGRFPGLIFSLAGVLYFGLLVLGLVLAGMLYPAVSLGIGLDTTQETSIRALASFCYHNDPIAFWQMTLLSVCIMVLIEGWLIVSHPPALKSFLKKVAFIDFFIHYFFWLIATDPQQPDGIHRFELDPAFGRFTALYFVIIILVSVGGLLLVSHKQKKARSLASPQEMPVVTFACPHCGTSYNSVVTYCVKCHKQVN